MTSLLLSSGKALRSGSALLLLGAAPSGLGSGSGGGGGGGGASGITAVSLQGGGQSNAVYANDYDGALLAMSQVVAFYLGATSAVTQSSNGNTDIGGCGSYEDIAGYAYFLTNTAGLTQSAAASAALSANGLLYTGFINGLTSPQRAAINAIVWYWGETDSISFGQSTKSVVKAALINFADQIRAAIGQSNAALPLILFGPPYATGNGPMTMREVWAEMAADPAQNAIWAVQQTYDSISRNEVWNATTGVSSGGNTDGGHRAAIDNVAAYNRGGLAAARAILASHSLAASLIPSALGSGLGPQITGAALSGTALTLTITHDGGNDIIVPLLASQGVGFSVMDGGTIASPGNLIQATACARVNATTLAVTLASAPTNAATSCRLMYPYPGEYWTQQPDTEIGRGCAVTDNFATVTKPSGFDVNASLGTGRGANMPLRSPVTITGSGSGAVAEYGMPLT